MANRRKKDWVKIIGIAVFMIVALISYLYSNQFVDLFGGKPDIVDADTYVDFIDCGQGDSTLIKSGIEVMLIDSTTRNDAEKVVEHLKKRGIERINHFVLTHPHEDHIGGAVRVLEEFEVDNIYMKRPTAGTEPTSSVYLGLLKSIASLGKKVTSLEAGNTFICGNFDFTVVGPLEEYEDLNNQSLVLHAVYDRVSFLFTGDMEAPAEKDLIREYGDRLNSTVLKAGHHGSSGSSSKAFLQTVAPKYAVISCGADNSYGHPHKETIERLDAQNVTYYRTDTQGTVTFITDGNYVQYQEAEK